MSDERMFPILGSNPKRYVPWAFLAPHEKRALSNHDQTLERLAERGGLGENEMISAVLDLPLWWLMHGDVGENVRLLEALVKKWGDGA